MSVQAAPAKAAAAADSSSEEESSDEEEDTPAAAAAADDSSEEESSDEEEDSDVKMADPPAAAVKSNKRKAAEGVAKVVTKAAACGTNTSKAWSSAEEKCFESEEECCTDKDTTATPVKGQVDKSSTVASCCVHTDVAALALCVLHAQLYHYTILSAICQTCAAGCAISFVALRQPVHLYQVLSRPPAVQYCLPASNLTTCVHNLTKCSW